MYVGLVIRISHFHSSAQVSWVQKVDNPLLNQAQSAKCTKYVT